MKDQLEAWIDSKTDWPILTTSIAKKWLNDGDGLQDRGITRDLDWGVPVKRGDDDWPGIESTLCEFTRYNVWLPAQPAQSPPTSLFLQSCLTGIGCRFLVAAWLRGAASSSIISSAAVRAMSAIAANAAARPYDE